MHSSPKAKGSPRKRSVNSKNKEGRRASPPKVHAKLIAGPDTKPYDKQIMNSSPKAKGSPQKVHSLPQLKGSPKKANAKERGPPLEVKPDTEAPTKPGKVEGILEKAEGNFAVVNRISELLKNGAQNFGALTLGSSLILYNTEKLIENTQKAKKLVKKIFQPTEIQEVAAVQSVQKNPDDVGVKVEGTDENFLPKKVEEIAAVKVEGAVENIQPKKVEEIVAVKVEGAVENVQPKKVEEIVAVKVEGAIENVQPKKVELIVAVKIEAVKQEPLQDKKCQEAGDAAANPEDVLAEADGGVTFWEFMNRFFFGE